MTSLFPEIVFPSRASHQSAAAGTHTWLTPPEVLDALGQFDLDPCACPDPRPWPTATLHWTREDGPLRRQWPTGARVWCNPPFSPKEKAAFMTRMADHHHGTALLFARTETKMFHDLVWKRATALLFLIGRLRFHHQDGRRASSASTGACLIAYGDTDAAALQDCGLPGKFVPL